MILGFVIVYLKLDSIINHIINVIYRQGQHFSTLFHYMLNMCNDQSLMFPSHDLIANFTIC